MFEAVLKDLRTTRTELAAQLGKVERAIGVLEDLEDPRPAKPSPRRPKRAAVRKVARSVALPKAKAATPPKPAPAPPPLVAQAAASTPRCGACQKAGHNRRTCPEKGASASPSRLEAIKAQAQAKAPSGAWMRCTVLLAVEGASNVKGAPRCDCLVRASKASAHLQEVHGIHGAAAATEYFEAVLENEDGE